MKRAITRHIKTLALILLLSYLFLSCKSSNKTVSDNKSRLEYNDSTQISKSAKSSQNTSINETIKYDITDDYDIRKVKTEYDTALPVDSLTGLHPVKAKTETNITKKKKDNSVKSVSENNITEINSNETYNTISSGNTEIISSSLVEKNVQKERDIFLKWIGAFSIVTIIIGVTLYIAYKKVKRN